MISRTARRATLGGVLALAAAALAGAAAAQAAPDRGAALFQVCLACHTAEKDGESAAGPNLWGVYGAHAAARTDFAYSPALKASGLVWDDATLDKWIEGPSKFVPGSQMAYPGMKDPADRQALIAYLKTKR
jgi:cytochrome c